MSIKAFCQAFRYVMSDDKQIAAVVAHIPEYDYDLFDPSTFVYNSVNVVRFVEALKKSNLKTFECLIAVIHECYGEYSKHVSDESDDEDDALDDDELIEQDYDFIKVTYKMISDLFLKNEKTYTLIQETLKTKDVPKKFTDDMDKAMDVALKRL